MRKGLFSSAILVALAITAAHGGAAAAEPKGGLRPVELNLDIRRITLKNGLRVVLNPDRTSPTASVCVTYDVGSRNEERGRSGFAHLFEHMMFQGSANVPKGGHFQLISERGGDLNGTTSSDRTNYFELVPANSLKLALWLEADRMKSLDVSADNFENQRRVVQEEYRMRVSNAPYVPAMLRLEELVYRGYWPYEHSTIGSMEDLEAAQLSWVQAFFRDHYAPNRAVLSVAGDVDPDVTLAWARELFEAIPQGPVAKPVEGALPEQTERRTEVVKDAHARTPGVFYGWAVPSGESDELPALELAARILGDGESSVLHAELVRDKAWAQEVSVEVEERRGPGLFQVQVHLTDQGRVGEVQRFVDRAIDNLASKGPTDAQLLKAKRAAQSSFVLDLESTMSRAVRLGEIETYRGDATSLQKEMPKIMAVRRDDVRAAVAKYLTRERTNLIEVYPKDRVGDGKEAKAAESEKQPAAGKGKKKKGKSKKKKASSKKEKR